jgi:hypothetical protein
VSPAQNDENTGYERRNGVTKVSVCNLTTMTYIARSVLRDIIRGSALEALHHIVVGLIIR